MGSGSEAGRRFASLALLVVGAGALLLAGAGALLLALDARAAAPGAEWSFYKPVILPDDFTGTGLVEVALDRDVYAHARPGLGDIRVAEADPAADRETPYQLIVEAGDHRRAAVPVKMRDLGHVPDEYTSFILDLQSAGDLHSEVEIQTTSANFQRRVSIAGSDDRETWRTLEENGRIFNLSIPERGFSTGDTRVAYPASGARFLRVRIYDEGQEPLSIRGGLVFFAQQLQPRRHYLPLVITERTDDVERKETRLLLDAGRAGFPANSIRLDIPQRNFYRQAALEGSNDTLAWAPVQSSETLYDFDTPKFTGSDQSMGFGESRYRYYRITIFNEDNPPLPVENARASGFVRKLIFSAEAGKSYRLYYGNPEASAPSYELERIFPYLVTENLPAARLGPHTPNPAFAEPAPPRPRPFTERYPWLLPVVVAAAALLVGFFLASLVRQVRGRLAPPE